MKLLTIGDLRDTINKWIDMSQLQEDTAVVLHDDELGEYYAALQARIIDGRVLISGCDDNGNEGPRVEIEEVVRANS